MTGASVMIKLTGRHYKNKITPTRRDWPKYSTQILNIAGQNSQAFRSQFVGHCKDTWLKMRSEGIKGTLTEWTNYYNSEHGSDGLVTAGEKIYSMIVKMQVGGITKDMCIDYVKEVVYNKTHMGMGGEEVAVRVVADYYNLPHRFSTAKEESQGIDGWAGKYPIQVKPHDSAFKGHVHNHPDKDKVLLVTYVPKKTVCYIHNPEFIPNPV